MSARQRPEAPGHMPGASSWARRFNQNTVELLAAWYRLAALCGSVVTAVTAVCSPFFGLDVAVAALISAAFTAAYAWLGFFYLANPEWKVKHDDDE